MDRYAEGLLYPETQQGFRYIWPHTRKNHIIATYDFPHLLLKNITGDMADIALFPGSIKLVSDGGRSNEFGSPGIEKSSISLLNMMPVLLPSTLEPKLENLINHLVDTIAIF